MVHVLYASLTISTLLVLVSGFWLNFAFAQNTTILTSYNLDTPDVTKPITIKVDQHVYQPGEEIIVEGLVWSEIINNVDAVGIVKLELRNQEGDIVQNEDASVDESGSFATTLEFLDGAPEGTYTLDAGLELEADSLGIVETLTSTALRSSVQFAVSEPHDYTITAENEDFIVNIATNSEVDNIELDQEEKKLSFVVEGEDTTAGFAEVTVPKRLLSGEMTIMIDENVVGENDVIIKSNSEIETVLEINYHHSIHQIEVFGTNVIPEFPLAAVIIAITMASVVALSLTARKAKLF